MKKKWYHSQRKSHFPSFHNIIIIVIQELNEKKKKENSVKNDKKNPNNAYFPSFYRYCANNRHFFEISSNISFFVFSFSFSFLIIIILNTKRMKVKLQKKCLFIFIILHTKKCRTDEDEPSKIQKFLHL